MLVIAAEAITSLAATVLNVLAKKKSSLKDLANWQVLRTAPVFKDFAHYLPVRTLPILSTLLRTSPVKDPKQ